MNYKDTRVKAKTSKIIGVRYVDKNGDAADDNARMIGLWWVWHRSSCCWKIGRHQFQN